MKYFSNKLRSDTALELATTKYSFGDIYDKANELTPLLKSKFIAGDCVLVSSKNPFIFVSLLFVFSRLNLVFCGINESSNESEIAKLTAAKGSIDTFSNDSRISCIQFDVYENVHHPGDLIVMTSGSTGQPKGVSLSLDRVIENALLAGQAIEFENYQLERWCIDIDMCLMSALSHLFMAWGSGVSLTHLKGVSSKELNAIFFFSKSGFGGAPLQLLRLAQRVEKFRGGGLLVSSGDFLSKSSIHQIKRMHKDINICSFYGLTELSGRFCFMSSDSTDKKPGLAGWPIIESSLIVDKLSGEVNAQSPLLFHGYYLNEGFCKRETAVFNTGDIGSIDKQGCLTLHGRVADTFKVSGEKVNRKIVEGALADLMAEPYCFLQICHLC